MTYAIFAGCCAHCPPISLEALWRSQSTPRRVLAPEASPYPLPPLHQPPTLRLPPVSGPSPRAGGRPADLDPGVAAAAAAASSSSSSCGHFYQLCSLRLAAPLTWHKLAASMSPTAVSPSTSSGGSGGGCSGGGGCWLQGPAASTAANPYEHTKLV